MVTSSNQIRKLLYFSFKKMFMEEDVAFLEHLESLMPNCISKEDNTILRSIPSSEEIKETLFSDA